MDVAVKVAEVPDSVPAEKIFPPKPAPPETVNAPEVEFVEAVESVIVTFPVEKIEYKFVAVRLPDATGGTA